MSTIHITQSHEFDRTQARARLSFFEDTLSKYGVRLQWNAYEAAIKGVGVSGKITVSDTEVDIDLKLGLIAKAAGVDPERLESSITRRLTAAMQ